MTWLVLLAGFLAADSNTLERREIDVCLVVKTAVPPATIKLFEHELRRRLDAQVRFVECGAPSAVRITVHPRPASDQAEDALGATRVRSGRLQPEIHVFREPVRRMLFSTLPVFEAKALATVAAHELTHWMTQEQRHRGEGFMHPLLTGAQLAGR